MKDDSRFEKISLFYAHRRHDIKRIGLAMYGPHFQQGRPKTLLNAVLHA
jgi:hypothetical protein